VPERAVDFLIVGGGDAGFSAARTLREEGAEGTITIVSRDPDPPYDRTAVSKSYLGGEKGKTETLLGGEEWFKDNDVELLTRASAMKLDPEAHTVSLANKDVIKYGKLLLATGANVRRLRIDGCDLEGIHYLRAFANSNAIRDDAAQAERVVLIGGSYIATEVAASLVASQGKHCELVMLEEVTLERFYGKEVGGYFQGVLEDHGVEIHGGQELDRFEGSGSVQKVVTKTGLELEGDCVVVGAGVIPDVTLGRSAGLDIGEAGGVRCSSRLETSVPGIYAAGDICEYDSPIHGRPMRIEHWDVAFNQGKTAALNMLGRETEHDVMPYFFSDLADWTSMEYVGPGSGEPVIRGSLDEGKFTAFYLDEGRVTAALTVGRSDDLEHAQRFITERSTPDPAALADESVDLAGLWRPE
jgi:3-phenylpropionate/trans-cinnamate dioxygenase ferredoxin reductase subunit